MDVNEQKQAEPTGEERTEEHTAKLPEAWQRFLDAVRRHYGKAPGNSND
ncbi:hypothetical protein ACFSO0_17155 [Brevibacillus sp. GCM10020057]